MWSRKELKDRAKATLSENYWRAFLVALVLMMIGGIDWSGPFNFDSALKDSNKPTNQTINQELKKIAPPIVADVLTNQPGVFKTKTDIFNTETGIEKEFNIPILSLFLGTVAIGAFLIFVGTAVVWHIFLGFPLQVGCRKYFLKASTNEAEYNQMTFCFNSETYWNVVKAMFMRSLFNALWYLALIVPGVIKSYAYSMVPYILSENPDMSYNEAIELSQKMTLGHKLDMFVLDFSFLGWYLLGFLFCGVGGLFVNPYYESTRAELYIILSAVAIETGVCSPERLNRVESDMVWPL